MKPFDSPQYRKRTRISTHGDECCLCGKHTSGIDGAIHVAVNHERGEFVTDEQAQQMGEACSLYPIGPECVKVWRKEFGGTSVRLRRASDGHGAIAYDEKK